MGNHNTPERPKGYKSRHRAPEPEKGTPGRRDETGDPGAKKRTIIVPVPRPKKDGDKK